MKHRLTHELLHYLKTKGYTMLVGIDRSALKEFIFTPVEWDVEEFIENSHFIDYRRYAVYFIDELLKVDLRHLFTLRVIMPENT